MHLPVLTLGFQPEYVDATYNSQSPTVPHDIGKDIDNQNVHHLPRNNTGDLLTSHLHLQRVFMAAASKVMFIG